MDRKEIEGRVFVLILPHGNSDCDQHVFTARASGREGEEERERVCLCV